MRKMPYDQVVGLRTRTGFERKLPAKLLLLFSVILTLHFAYELQLFQL